MKKQLLFMFVFMLIGFVSFGQVTTVGIIGSATPNGWDSDIDMVQDASDTCVWTVDITLTSGAVKFRANDAWDINWGSADFPTGVGTQGGANIPVFEGEYTVIFNSCTGEYKFDVHSPIGIIGDATPGGWDEDTNMFEDSSGVFFIDLELKVGGAKFRKDDNWDVNWGSADFPSGVGTQGGPNIEVSKAGKYHITFDTTSGAYNFEEKVEFEYIGLIGDATPGGWDTDTDMQQDANDPDVWQVDITLTEGKFKFRANHDWGLNWGGGTFPRDTAEVNGGDIEAVPGDYRVTFNTNTLIYDFVELKKYEAIGIIGDATPGGWDADTDLVPNEDSTIWKVDMTLKDGGAKFRANHDWTVNWGGADFPSGVGEQDGANIPVVAGDYHVSINTLTGEYNFEVFVVYDEISIVGKDGPFGAWPDDTPNFDTYMTVDADNNQLWTATEVTLTEADTTASDSGIKFRANTDWSVNWGARDFPSGTGTQDGPNIWCKAGTYDVTFNSLTGEYAFTLSNGITDLIDPSDISVYPNPANQILNVDISAFDFGNQVVVRIYDIGGKLVNKTITNSKDLIKVNTSKLNEGNYFMNITGNGILVAKKFTILK